MRKLYEINEDIERLLDEAYTIKIDDSTAVDTQTGEIVNIAERLNALTVEKNEKIKSVAVYFDDMKMKAAALKEKIDTLSAMKKSLDRDIKGLEDYLIFATNGTGYKDSDVDVKIKESKRCEILDETLIPEKFFSVKVEKSVSKTEITKAIKGGESVPGAEIRTHYKVEVM